MSIAENIAREEAQRARKPKGRKKAVGRKDSEGQEQVMRPDVLKERAKELMRLDVEAKDAATAFGDAVKVCAEKSGFNASTVRKLIRARNSDDFAGAKAKVEQLGIAFEKVGEA